MPSQLHPRGAGGLMRYQATYLKGDGSPGELEAAPMFSSSAPGLADMTLAPDGAHAVKFAGAGEVAPGVYEVQFRHNGSMGQVVVTCSEVDGDLGEGKKLIGPFTDTMEVLGPMGAETGGFNALPEETI